MKTTIQITIAIASAVCVVTQAVAAEDDGGTANHKARDIGTGSSTTWTTWDCGDNCSKGHIGYDPLGPTGNDFSKDGGGAGTRGGEAGGHVGRPPKAPDPKGTPASNGNSQ